MNLPFSIPASEFLEGPHGLTIHYRRRGSPDRPTLLLIPGGWQSLLCWRRQMQPFSHEFQVIAWDTPGHGGTHFSNGTEVPFSADTYADAMETVIDRLHLRETGYIAVGWSWGGWTIRNCLLKYGMDGLRGIVLVGSALNFIELLQTLQGPLARQFAEMASQIHSQNRTEHQQGVLTFMSRLTEQPLSEEEYYLTLGYTVWTMMTGDTLRSWHRNQLPGDAVALVREQKIPVLFIQGESDVLFPLQIVRPAVVEHGAELYICKSGHSPFLEQPAVFNEQVLTFARRVFAFSQASAS